MNGINYITIPTELYQFELSEIERNIFALVLSFKSSGLIACNDRLSQTFCKSRATITNAITKLEKAEIVVVKNRQSKYRKILLNPNLLTNSLVSTNILLTNILAGKAILLTNILGSTYQPVSTISKEVKKEEEEERGINQVAFVDYWNSKPNLPQIKNFTNKRKRQLKTRMSEKAFADNWELIIDTLLDSEFCTGQNERGWKSDVDWILKNIDNYTKVLEGKYNNKQPKEQSGQAGYTYNPPTEEEAEAILRDL